MRCRAAASKVRCECVQRRASRADAGVGQGGGPAQVCRGQPDLVASYGVDRLVRAAPPEPQACAGLRIRNPSQPAGCRAVVCREKGALVRTRMPARWSTRARGWRASAKMIGTTQRRPPTRDHALSTGCPCTTVAPRTRTWKLAPARPHFGRARVSRHYGQRARKSPWAPPPRRLLGLRHGCGSLEAFHSCGAETRLYGA